MMPAENPKDRLKKFLLVFLANKAMPLPIPVDKPAMVVRKKANNISE
jgi:hypothetical protein